MPSRNSLMSPSSCTQLSASMCISSRSTRRQRLASGPLISPSGLQNRQRSEGSCLPEAQQHHLLCPESGCYWAVLELLISLSALQNWHKPANRCTLEAQTQLRLSTACVSASVSCVTCSVTHLKCRYLVCIEVHLTWERIQLCVEQEVSHVALV